MVVTSLGHVLSKSSCPAYPNPIPGMHVFKLGGVAIFFFDIIYRHHYYHYALKLGYTGCSQKHDNRWWSARDRLCSYGFFLQRAPPQCFEYPGVLGIHLSNTPFYSASPLGIDWGMLHGIRRWIFLDIAVQSLLIHWNIMTNETKVFVVSWSVECIIELPFVIFLRMKQKSRFFFLK